MVADVLTAMVLLFIGHRLYTGARVSLQRRARVRHIVRGIRWRHVWPVPLVLTAVVVTAGLLLLVPGLDLGWWTLLGGTGNPVTGMTDRTADSALAWLVPTVFLVLLVPALPLFAEAEERMFRLGAERWSVRRRLGKAVLFGLAHALIGIPVGVALALSLGGLYFTACYLRAWRRSGGGPEAALLESTRAHLAYNGGVLAIVLVAVVVEVVVTST